MAAASGSPADRVRRLAPELVDDARVSDRLDGFPTRSIDALRRDGLLAAPLPRRLGGEGLGGRSRLRELLDLLAAIGRAHLAAGRIFEGHVNALQLVWRFGSEAHLRRVAADAIDGHLFGVWNTEAAGGVSFVDGRTPGAVALRGSKTFASGVGHVTRALVTGRDLRGGGDTGWQMAVVPTDACPPVDDPAFWQPLGMRATASHRAGFDGIELDASALVGLAGDYYRQPAFGAGAVRFAAVQQGGIEALFDETRRFLRRLGRTDDAHQRARLGEMAWQVESGRLWLEGMAAHAAAAMPNDQDNPAEVHHDVEPEAADRAVAYANLARSAIESIGMRTIALADRAVGARGLLQPEPFERLHRDLAHYLRQPAPDAAVADAGRHVLEDEADAAVLWMRTHDSHAAR